MTWTHAQPGALMTTNIDGTQKKNPTIWMPESHRLFIPNSKQNHARPIILLHGENPSQTFTIILHRNQINGRYQGREKVMVEF